MLEHWTETIGAGAPKRRLISVSFRGLRFSVAFDESRVEEHLRERFGGFYSIDSGHGPRVDYEIVATRAAIDSRVERAVRGGAPVIIQPHPNLARYFRAGNVVHGGEQQLIREEPSGTVFVVSRSTRRVHVVNPDAEGLARGVRRLVRDLFAARMLRERVVELHASGVCVDGRAIAFVGASNSGKTTALLRALFELQAKLMSNGRLFLEGQADQIVAIGPPEHVLVRLGTLAEWSELAAHYPESLRDTLASGASAWDLRSKEKVSLQLDDLRRVGVATHAAAPLGAVIFVDLSRQTAEPLRRIDSPSARLLQNLEAPAGCSRRFWHQMEAQDDAALEARRANLAARIDGSVPCFEVTRDAYGALPLRSILMQVLEVGC